MRMFRNIAVGVGMVLLGVMPASEAWAQARPVKPVVPAAVQPAVGKESVVIQKFEVTGQGTKVKTPQFLGEAGDYQGQARDWARITVKYATDAEWIDELEFRYRILAKNPKTGAYTMFPGSVTYTDIARGNHIGTVFLRPSTLARYGAVEGAEVKVYVKGLDMPLAMAQVPNDPRIWNSEVKTREGVVLNRDQTPFGLIGIDSFETIKPK